MDTAKPSPPLRSAERTMAAITWAARDLFARNGFERTTIRGVAAQVGVDPALVIRYFENKAGLFARAVDLEVGLPDLSGLSVEEMAQCLISRFFEVWEADVTFLALLRAASTSEVAVERMREVFAEQVAPALGRGAIDRPEQRAALVGSQVLGFAFSRYVLRTPPLVAMTHDDVQHWLGPMLVRYLTEPHPYPDKPGHQAAPGDADPRPTHWDIT